MSSNQNAIFLCYGREDLVQVQQIYLRIKNAGLDPWMDKPPKPYEWSGVIPGNAWASVTDERLRSAKYVLAFLSSRSVEEEGYVNIELRLAAHVQTLKPANTVYLIPVLLGECKIPEFRAPLVNPRDLDWFEMGAGQTAKLCLAERGFRPDF